MKYDGATIEVVNWLEYNPRMDSKKPTWFRFENSIATGSGFSDLSAEQKWLWVFILSLVSQANGQPIVWKSIYCQKMTGISIKKQDSTIEILEKFVRLRVSREVTLRDSPATDGRTDGRTNGQLPPSAVFDFEKIYEKYPRKEGKTKGLKQCVAQIKTQEDFDFLCSSVDRYRRKILADGTDPKFIKHFSSFMSSWRDWIDPHVGKTIVDEPRIKKKMDATEAFERTDPARVREILKNFGLNKTELTYCENA